MSCHLQITTVFTSSFVIWMCFFSFCLIAVDRTFNTMLKKSSENGHSCLIPDFKESTFRFSLLSMLPVGFVIYGLYYIEMFPLFPLCCEFFFYHKWVLGFVKCFSTSDMIMRFLAFILFLWYITLIDLQMLNQPFPQWP